MNNIKNINWGIIKWIFIVVVVLLYLQSQRYHFIKWDSRSGGTLKVFRYDKFTGKSKAYDNSDLYGTKLRESPKRDFGYTLPGEETKKDTTYDPLRKYYPKKK